MSGISYMHLLVMVWYTPGEYRTIGNLNLLFVKFQEEFDC